MIGQVKTKDSGQRQEFSTGARRDTQDNKPRFDLIPIEELDRMQQMAGGSTSIFKDVDYASPPIVGELPEIEGTWQAAWERYDKGQQPYFVAHEDYRPDLIPHIVINRLAHLFGRGAKKYGDNNWQKGIPLGRVYASLLRHVFLWAVGDRSEDHLAAIVWNACTLMWTETEVWEGRLPTDLADAGPLSDWIKENTIEYED